MFKRLIAWWQWRRLPAHERAYIRISKKFADAESSARFRGVGAKPKELKTPKESDIKFDLSEQKRDGKLSWDE